MYLCIDYGERYVGIAATDSGGAIPYRYGTIDQKKQPALDAIADVIAREHIQKVLVGVPVGLEGNATEQTRICEAFIVSLRSALGDTVPVEAVDETLTSVEARRILQFEGGKEEDEHAEAARIMLQDYLRNKGK